MQKTQVVLHGWLSRCPPDERAALERFLPEEERTSLATLSPAAPPPAEDTSFNEEPFHKVHWSWFVDPIKMHSAKEQKLFLTAFDPLTADQLGSILQVKVSPEPVTPLGKAFLRDELLLSLAKPHEQILPREFLPESPLNVLLTLEKKELVRLIHILSLYDLCAELRQMVDTKMLKKICSFLTPEHQAALKLISAKTLDSHQFPKMGLDRTWDGTKESLYVQLHRRGLARLGVALSGEHPDLIWTLCHHLDIGRGSALMKLCSKEKVPDLSNIAIQQTLESLDLRTDKG